MKMVSGVHNLGGCKTVKWQTFNGSLARRLFTRILMFALVISMLPLLQLLFDFDPENPMFMSSDGCDTERGYFDPNSLMGRVLKPVAPFAFPHLGSEMCQDNVNLTIDVVRELMGKKLLSYGAKALCIGQGTASVSALREIGFLDVDQIHRHPFFMIKQKQVVCELDFDDNSYDFVITKDLRKVSVPAVLVGEVERILKPGGTGAMLVSSEHSNHDTLIRSANTVSSYLKNSIVIDVVTLGSFTLVAFKKKGSKKMCSFEQYHLPTSCPSINRSKPIMNMIEPLVDKKPKSEDHTIAYLPKIVSVPSNGKLVYIDMGSKEVANFSNMNWFLPSYPIDSKAFSVYIVDHDALVLSSHVRTPGVTFIYHPALGGTVVKDKSNSLDDDDPHPLIDYEDFDFLVWLKETLEFADFVVLKMNTGKGEIKFLSELFESGIICYVDELFLHNHDDGGGVGESNIDLIKSLRNNGVFAHQWWGN